MTRRVDFLIIGSGIAGLAFALKASAHGKVMIVTKTRLEETNTRYAQGGIAAVTDLADSIEKHVKDTLVAGCGLNDANVVRLVATEGPERISEMLSLGMDFDRNTDGSFNLAREGGHSEYRVLHHKDSTGQEIQRVLTLHVKNNPNIEILEHHFAIDLMTQHHLGKEVKRSHTDIQCFGAYILDLKTHSVFRTLAKTTLVATGGVGNLYSVTTNPLIATGDGIAMTYRAKGIVEKMEFIQFHPTSLYNPGERPSFLITEALRGFGAILRTMDHEAFMEKYDERGSLAPRDIVARAIDHELKKRGEDYVLLDATHLSATDLRKNFPNIYKKCLKTGIDITSEPIPVVPAAHYLCGGIRTDLDGRTNIHHLYAAGEVASTGLHGANRLASNSLIEALVFAHRAALHAISRLPETGFMEEIPEWNDEGTTNPREMVLITQNMKEMQQLMTNYVGIVRSDKRLQRAFSRLEIIFRETEDLYKKSKLSLNLCELRNLINVGYLVIKQASQRKESIGLHYNIDSISQNN